MKRHVTLRELLTDVQVSHHATVEFIYCMHCITFAATSSLLVSVLWISEPSLRRNTYVVQNWYQLSALHLGGVPSSEESARSAYACSQDSKQLGRALDREVVLRQGGLCRLAPVVQLTSWFSASRLQRQLLHEVHACTYILATTQWLGPSRQTGSSPFQTSGAPLQTSCFHKATPQHWSNDLRRGSHVMHRTTSPAGMGALHPKSQPNTLQGVTTLMKQIGN